MRKFWSYGSPIKKYHYCVPRQALIDTALLKLIGENPDEGGHYITVWAPRQRGKTWIMEEVLFSLRDNPTYQAFDVVYLPLESLKGNTDIEAIKQKIGQEILEMLGLKSKISIVSNNLEDIFKQDILSKPLILILDEFDALVSEAINAVISVFRNIHFRRRRQLNIPSAKRDYLLHGVALIGVRAVLGIENKSGSPFNVQHSLHIPNLTFAEVDSMFKSYQQEHGQQVEQAVIDRVFNETQGQPGLVGWLGELLTETYNKHNPSITMADFKFAYAMAINVLPNSNVVNIVSKAKQQPHKQLLLELFQTDKKIAFHYDDPTTNFLYMNGVIDVEIVDDKEQNIKFPCPLIQKRLFNYFSNELFRYVGRLHDPFDELNDVFTLQGLTIKNLLKRYEAYLQKNGSWLFENAPRRADMRLYEAVYHFNFYAFLLQFFQSFKGEVWPEFPTGNGQIDILIKYQNQIYGLEVKSFTNRSEYNAALTQAAQYGHKLGLTEITLVLFIETIDEANRTKFEVLYTDEETKVMVEPVFVVTGN